MAQQSTCKECGWPCRSCDDQELLQLHVEVENLKQQLLERENHIRIMEGSFLAEADKFPNGEAAALTEELLTWQDKYSRLYESYKRVQKVNQSLEDKLLRIVDKCETEKNDLLKEVSNLTQRLIDARSKVNRLQSENERYRNDVNLAIHLLQCKPANFVPQKYESLPADLQQKVLAYVCGRRRPSDVGAVPIRLEMRTIKVPVSTSPPSSMLYPVNKGSSRELNIVEMNEEEQEELNVCERDFTCPEGRPPLDNVSAAIMAKVLEERERERQQARHCESCSCFTHVAAVTVDSSTQTAIGDVESNSLCLNGYAATTRGSQGLVRFVDSLSRNSSGNIQTNCPSRLGIKISEGKILKSEIQCVSGPSQEQNSSIKLDKRNKDAREEITNESVFQSSEFCSSSDLCTESEMLECVICDSHCNEKDSTVLGNCHQNVEYKTESKNLLDLPSVGESVPKSNSVYPSSSDTAKFGKENCIIDLEISSDGRSDVPNASRGKELLTARNSGETLLKGGQNLQTVNTSFGMKLQNRDTRSTTHVDVNTPAKSPSNWIRYPSDTSKKSTLVVSSDKANQSLVRPTETSTSRMAFPTASVRGSNRIAESCPGAGPRLCSMRLQAGTSNILLDNATSYEPVLYTSRHTQDGVEAWGVSASRSGAAVLVHAPRSRGPSLEEPQQQNRVALWVHANPAQTGT